MAKDGSKVIISIEKEHAEHADALVDALNAKNPFNGFFKFSTLPRDPSGGVQVQATGQWSLPGNQRPAHGTMQTWAEGYLQALKDAAKKPAQEG